MVQSWTQKLENPNTVGRIAMNLCWCRVRVMVPYVFGIEQLQSSLRTHSHTHTNLSSLNALFESVLLTQNRLKMKLKHDDSVNMFTVLNNYLFSCSNDNTVRQFVCVFVYSCEYVFV